MASLAHQEVLLTALDGALRADAKVAAGDLSMDAVRGQITAFNRMYDAAMDCGMPQDEADVTGWAAIAASRFLVEA